MKLLILLFSILLPLCVFGKITGIVLDAGFKQPIAGASIYINNSTVGTISSEDGSFVINQTVQPPFTLVISSIGFASQSLQIEKPQAHLEIFLQEQQTLLNEVKVVPGVKDPWEEYGPIFFREFIGYSSFAKQCKILNHQDISFYYDIDQNQLRAFSNVPIKIENKALGYLIDYWLDDFIIDYNRKSTFYKGYSFFTEQNPKNSKQGENWERNRLRSYLGSLTHFLRSLHSNNINEQGFEMRTLIRFKGKDYGKYVPIWTDSLMPPPEASENQIRMLLSRVDTSKAFLDSSFTIISKYFEKPSSLPLKIDVPLTYKESGQWLILRKTASEKIVVSYFDTLQKAPNPYNITNNLIPNYDNYVYQILYTDLVPIDSMRIMRNDSILLSFKDFLMIRYVNETAENKYTIKESLAKGSYQESIISIRQPVTIFQNGNYQNTYDLFLEGYWSFEKLDKLLPIDYNTKSF